MEWKIARGQGKCMVCQGELEEDAVYYSALIEKGEGFERRDYCPTCWANRSGEVFSFWQTRVTRNGPRTRPIADKEVLLDFFSRLESDESPERRKIRYLLALILMRKKVLKFENIEKGAGPFSGLDFLVLRESGTDRRHKVLDPGLSQKELEPVKEQLNQILFQEA